MVELSIVIPSYNSAATIRRCLGSLLPQVEGREAEIIVVDSGFDATAEIVRKEFPQVRLVKLSRRVHQAEARNIGLEHASGAIVGFVDADCIVHPAWVENTLALHKERPEAMAITGTIENGTPRNLIGTLLYLMEFNEFVPGSPERYIGILLGGNLSVKRRPFEAKGLRFPDIYHSEDTLLAAQIVQTGGRILFSPRTVVAHINRTSFLGATKHSFVLGRASGRARKKGNLYGRWLRFFPFLCAVLPYVRWIRGMSRLIRFNRGYALQFLLLTPLYVLFSSVWSIGFLLGILTTSESNGFSKAQERSVGGLQRGPTVSSDRSARGQMGVRAEPAGRRP